MFFRLLQKDLFLRKMKFEAIFLNKIIVTLVTQGLLVFYALSS